MKDKSIKSRIAHAMFIFITFAMAVFVFGALVAEEISRPRLKVHEFAPSCATPYRISIKGAGAYYCEIYTIFAGYSCIASQWAYYEGHEKPAEYQYDAVMFGISVVEIARMKECPK